MCQRTFQRGHQIGAGVTTLGLRTAVEVDWRLQMNKPDPAIPTGQEISTSAGANSGNEVSQAGAKNTWTAWPLPSLFGLPLVSFAVAIGICQAEPRRHS